MGSPWDDVAATEQTEVGGDGDDFNDAVDQAVEDLMGEPPWGKQRALICTLNEMAWHRIRDVTGLRYKILEGARKDGKKGVATVLQNHWARLGWAVDFNPFTNEGMDYGAVDPLPAEPVDTTPSRTPRGRLIVEGMEPLYSHCGMPVYEEDIEVYIAVNGGCSRERALEATMKL